METKIDYIKQYEDLRQSAENELIEVLKKFPNETYNFLTEEEYDELNDNVDKFVELDIPVLTMRDDFNNRLISVYVTSVSVFKTVLVISGFEQPLYSDLEIKDYHSSDVYSCQIAEIFKYINISFIPY